LPLAGATRLEGRGADRLYGNPRQAVTAAGHRRHHLPKGAEEIQDPAKLRRLVGLIEGEGWLGLGVDVKGTIYEGLLETQRPGGEVGPGSIFTPRALIDAIVTLVDPEPQEACTTRLRYRRLSGSPLEHMRKKPLARNAEVYTAMRRASRASIIVPRSFGCVR